MGTLERLRKAKGLSQQDVGEALGISQAAVAMWETGKSKPTIDKLQKLAELFGCSIDNLFEKGR